MNKRSLKIGDVFTHPVYGEYSIVEYIDCNNVKIVFTRTGYVSRASSGNIRKNSVRDRNQPKLVHGVGLNDATYQLQYKVTVGRKPNGKIIQKLLWVCPFYDKWQHILRRCYSELSLSKDPQYKGCRVCDEWLVFSNFRSWMETQDWEGKELDKDLLGNGKLYSPETCCFLTNGVNKFMTDRRNYRGEFLLGVHQKKPTHRFSANCNNLSGKSEYLGRFETELEAHKAWQAKKHEYACQLAELQEDNRVADALRQRYAPDKDWTQR
jgi:hypothetical protein